VEEQLAEAHHAVDRVVDHLVQIVVAAITRLAAARRISYTEATAEVMKEARAREGELASRATRDALRGGDD
jgi:hypothetical protein